MAKSGTKKHAKKPRMPIWDRVNPRRHSVRLTPEQKADAQRIAEAHGRDRPSLVDDINARPGTGGTTKQEKARRTKLEQSGKKRCGADTKQKNKKERKAGKS